MFRGPQSNVNIRCLCFALIFFALSKTALLPSLGCSIPSKVLHFHKRNLLCHPMTRNLFAVHQLRLHYELLQFLPSYLPDFMTLYWVPQYQTAISPFFCLYKIATVLFSTTSKYAFHSLHFRNSVELLSVNISTFCENSTSSASCHSLCFKTSSNRSMLSIEHSAGRHQCLPSPHSPASRVYRPT